MKNLQHIGIFLLSLVIAPHIVVGQDTPSTDTKPKAERHEFVQRGKDAKEMALGDCGCL